MLKLATFDSGTTVARAINFLLISPFWDKTVGCNTGFHITCIDKQCQM